MPVSIALIWPLELKIYGIKEKQQIARFFPIFLSHLGETFKNGVILCHLDAHEFLRTAVEGIELYSVVHD